MAIAKYAMKQCTQFDFPTVNWAGTEETSVDWNKAFHLARVRVRVIDAMVVSHGDDGATRSKPAIGTHLTLALAHHHRSNATDNPVRV